MIYDLERIEFSDGKAVLHVRVPPKTPEEKYPERLSISVSIGNAMSLVTACGSRVELRGFATDAKDEPVVATLDEGSR